MKNSAPRLVIVRPAFYEQIVGGSEYQVYLLAERAKAAGVEVHCVYINYGVPCPNKLDIELHPVKRMPLRKTLGPIWSLYWPAISHNLKRIRPNVVYVRGGYSWAAMTASYARRNSCRSVWQVAHTNDVTPFPLYRNWRRPFHIGEKLAIEYAIRNSDCVVCHARYQAELLKKHYGRSSEVVLKEQPEPTEALLKGSVVTVVWVANIKEWKQPEMFIRLAGEFKDNPSVRFVMIGRPATGAYQKQLENKIVAVPNLDYRGELPIEEVNRILAESHIFVNTSVTEGLPNTFVQAWMREVPVVGMVWDPDDILRSGTVGLLSGSFEQMVKDIRNLIGNPRLRDEMGKRAREYALKNHSIETNMKKLLDLILPELKNTTASN